MLFRSAAVSAAVILALGAAACLFAPSLLTGGSTLPSGGDPDAWLDAALFDQTARSALAKWGALPLQNPYIEGGYPLGAHPDDGSLSPLSAALLPVDAVAAVKLKTLLALLCAMGGIYHLARKSGAGRMPAFAVALFLPVSGFAASCQARAPLDLQILFVLPALAVVLDARAKILPAALAAGCVTLAGFQSGSLILIAPVAVTLTGLVRALGDQKNRGEAAKMTGLVLMFSLLFGCVKWFPAVGIMTGQQLRALAGPAQNVASYDFLSHLRTLTAAFAPAGSEWVALPLIALAVYGVIVESKRKRISLLAAAFLAMSFFPVARPPAAPDFWVAIRPFSHPLTVTPVFFLGFVCVLSAIAMQHLISARPKAGYFLLGAAAALACVPASGARPVRVETIPGLISMQPYDKIRQDPFSFYSVTLRIPPGMRRPLEMHPTLFVRGQIGVINALTSLRGARRASPKLFVEQDGKVRYNRGYDGEAWLQKQQGRVLAYSRTANRMEILTNPEKGPSELLINSNFDPGWRTQKRTAMPSRGLLAVRLDQPGEQRVVLTNRRLALTYGLTISLLSLAGAVILGLLEALVDRK